MQDSPRFALNHIVAPQWSFPAFAELAQSLGVAGVEIRNDLPGVAMNTIRAHGCFHPAIRMLPAAIAASRVRYVASAAPGGGGS